MRGAVSAFTTMFLLGMLATSSALSGTWPVEGAVEARKLLIEPGSPARVKAFACDTCTPETFELDDNIMLFVNGERVPVEQLKQRQGHAGTVIYNLESGRAVRLRW